MVEVPRARYRRGIDIAESAILDPIALRHCSPLALRLLFLAFPVWTGCGGADPTPPASDSAPVGSGDAKELTTEQRQARAQLEAIGYVGGVESPPERSGVTVHVPARVVGGLNLFTSGHRPEATLMDMEGRTLHRWRFRYADLPGARKDASPSSASAWRRVHLLEDGSLLAIHEGLGLIKLDRDSRLLWYYDGRAHHDLEVQDDGRILVLTRQIANHEDLHPSLPVLEDFVCLLDADGKEQRRISLIEAYRGTEFAQLLEDPALEGREYFHTNTLELLDGSISDRVPAFRRGNLLLSMRTTSSLAVLDLESEKIVWSARGEWRFQHQPTILPNGNLLLLDNEGYDGSSQVLELDPATLEERWAYRGVPPESFYTALCGTSQRLSGGNTLITESNRGRAFEVTPDGEIVWEFVNRHRTGPRRKLIATIFEMVRLETESPPGWLDE